VFHVDPDEVQRRAERLSYRGIIETNAKAKTRLANADFVSKLIGIFHIRLALS
jgi:hypothetical protein